MKTMIALFVLAIILMGSAFAILWDHEQHAYSHSLVFDTYTHAILCDSLILDLTELKKSPKEASLIPTVKLMIRDDCPGTTLP